MSDEARWFEVDGVYDGEHDQRRHLLYGNEAEALAREIRDRYLEQAEDEYVSSWEISVYPHSCAAWKSGARDSDCRACNYRLRSGYTELFWVYHFSAVEEAGGWWPGFRALGES